MAISRLIVSLALIAFVACLIWGFMTGAPLDLDAFSADPWVFVGTMDLIFGFVLFAVIIAWTEKSPIKAAPWIVALFILGNVVSAVWLLARFNVVRERLRPAQGS